MKNKVLASVAIAAMSASMAAQSMARDYISIVGSSTVYPFATVVIENFGKKTAFKTPVIESTGSGGGLKLFCSGVGESNPDITNSSRAIKNSEIELCASNGVTEIIEVKIGYDGIAFANSKAAPHFDLTREDIFNALAKEVVVNGKIVKNPYQTWKDVNPTLPATKIEVLGPPPTSGTRDAFVELVMDVACKSYPMLKEADKCDAMREDGAFIEAGENDNLIIQKLKANPDAFGIFGYSFLDQNADSVQGSHINGVAPTFDAIANGEYPVSRPLFFYVKKAHIGVIPGIKEFLAEFTSPASMGEDGYLSDKGLIPLPRNEYGAIVKRVRSLEAM